MEQKVPKKRGRKPGSKNKTPEEKSKETTTGKKKRGRKPKSNVTINENPIFESENKINNHLIIKINNKSNNLSLDNINNEINNFLSNDINLNENYSNINYNQNINKETSDVCWNCCHSFNKVKIGLPIKYINNIFYTYGNFCSLECSSRFCFDNFNNDISEIYSTINLYNLIVNKSNKNVKCAPHRLALDMFGGPLSIDKYRETFNNQDFYNVTIPPIVQLNTQISLPEQNKYYNKEHLKLYRKKEINNNNIINMMNLK